MATVKPFRGVRYNSNKVGDLSKVVAQPYDRIEHGLQEKYYDLHPYNIARITKGKEYRDDDAAENVYTRARDYYQVWLDAGYLLRDTEPAFYVYYQTFALPDGTELTRRAYISALELVEFDQGIVLPHERTLAGPKVDRLNLMRATAVNFGQIFMLYPDQENRINAILDAAIAGRPADIDVRELWEKDVRQQVWAVTDPQVLAQVAAEMAPKTGLIIADGHHRYETALNYRNEQRARHPDAAAAAGANAPFNYCMVTLVSMDDPGLTILPTHREINNYSARTTAEVLDAAREYFQVVPMPDRAALEAAMPEDSPSERHIGFYDGSYYLLKLKDLAVMDEVVPNRAPEWRSLHVSILHELLIERIMGISKAAVEAKENIDYHRDLGLALQHVDSGQAQAVFIMNPTRMSQVKACSDRGEKMPQKSTDFYPKVITGLVSMPVGEKEQL